MLKQLKTALVMMVLLTIITGGVYPVLVTVIAQGCMPSAANGSLLKQQDRVVGSELIGQAFSKPEYCWGRLSATSPVPYNASASSGSNFGPLHADLQKNITDRITALQAWPVPNGPVPIDLVTASASGLDPDISPAAAAYQVPRLAQARQLSEDRVREVIARCTEYRFVGILGEPRVNVLKVNLALDQQSR